MNIIKQRALRKSVTFPIVVLVTALAAVLAAGLSGCAAISGQAGSIDRNTPATASPEETSGEQGVPVDTIVAIDLVSALMQLPDFAPFYTTVQFSEPRTPFGGALRKAMTQSGFGIQMVEQDQGVHYVSYATRVVTTEGGESMEYSVNIKDLEIQRRYKVEEESIYPLSEIMLSGVKPSKVIVNDEIYVRHAGGVSYPTGVSFLDDDGKVLDQNTTFTQANRSWNAVSGESITNEHYLVLARASIFTVDRIQGKASNVYNKKDYRPRKQLTVRFRSKSLSLGNANKRGISKMLDSFEPAKDVYTITGCSHGRSLMFDGTEDMALSRSQRVKEELLSYGIKQDNLREEGCFQTEYGEALPPNGVIITHKRRVSARS